MFKVAYAPNFLKSAEKLSNNLQTKLADLLAILEANPFNPRLHTKHLAGQLTGLLSFRITRDWRVIFRFLEPRIIQLVDVARRKDIYR